MLKLTYNSLLLIAFGTIMGGTDMERMSMGVCPLFDILQVALDHIFTPEEYPFMCNITDDIVIVGYNNGQEWSR